jgi:Bacterial Ig-like domain (group 2)
MDGDERRINESTEPIINPFNWRILLLAVYLFLLLAFSSYLLGSLMLADTTDLERYGTTLTSCKDQVDKENKIKKCDANADCLKALNMGSAANTAPTATPNPSTPTATPNTATPTSNTTTAANTLQESSIPIVIKVDGGYSDNHCLTGDGYVFLIVLFAGMVGATIRVVFSFLVHLGRKDFGFNWAWYYIFLPYFGGTLSLVIYFVIRGGFYGGAIGKPLYINVFSFAALGALTGLFSDQAMEKLKLVAESLLTKTESKTSQAKIAKITIPASVNLTAADSKKQLSATATDAQSNPISGLSTTRFQWVSDNVAVAEVDQNGLVDWKSSGTCNVTATADTGVVSNVCKIECG